MSARWPLERGRAAPAVTLVTSSLSPSGGGIYEVVRHAASRLGDEGIGATVMGLRDGAFQRADFGSAQVSDYRVAGSRKVGFAPRLLRDLIQSDVDLVHLHGLWMYPSLAVRLWHARTGRALVVSPHGMLDPWALERGAWKKQVSGRLFEFANLRRATVLHAVSRQEFDSIRAFGLRNPVAIIPNGVELAPARDTRGGPAQASDPRRVLLFLGRLHPKKGLLELIKAWSLALARAPHLRATWRIVIAGWPDAAGYRDALSNAIRDAGLGSDVALVGGVTGDRKADTYRGACAFVLPSRSEGMPLSVLEAWSYGLPVFMTEACNIPAGFQEGAASKLELDPDEMANVFVSTLGDQRRLAKMGDAGRALAAREFGLDVMARRLAALYRWGIDGGEPPEFVERG